MKTSFSMIATLGVASAALISVACSEASDPTPINGGGFGTGGAAAPGATGGAAPVPGATGGAAPVPGATGGAAPGATGGSAPVGGTDSDFVTGGLGESGTWKGYLFTAVADNSTITPEAFDGSEICVSGSLEANYEAWAMVGWNIAQTIDETTFEGGAVNAVAPGGTGVSYNIVNNDGTSLRIQIQDSDMPGAQAWCADVPSGGGTGVIPWGDFTKECWMAGGEAYSPTTPIAQVAVQQPAASETSTTAFSYCVVHLGPA